MSSVRLVSTLLATLLAASACDSDDLGTDCPQMELPESGFTDEGDWVRSEGLEVAEVNALFPCESATCVATIGRGSYCSRRCRSSESCPSAFTCRPIVEFGTLAEESYCAWRECQWDFECGDEGKYKCRAVPALSLGGTTVKLCDLR